MTERVPWSRPIVTPDLARDEIHIWRASLSVDKLKLESIESTLSGDERTRAARFIFQRDRDRFIAARGILRDLLGRYLQCGPGMIDLAYGPHGKPTIVKRGSQPAICFNLSHSHLLTAIAIASAREVGIDIEMIQPEFAGEEIAKRYFSTQEIDELCRLPSELRVEGFFLCWTRKEAYIKAKGDGLQIPLDSFDVSLTSGSPIGPVNLSSVDESRWRIESFAPSVAREPRYAGAVAAGGKDWTARYFEWEPE